MRCGFNITVPFLAWTAAVLALALPTRADGPGHVVGAAPGKLVPSRGVVKAGCSVIPDDSNTFSHVCLAGGALVDVFGEGWTEVGTVPKIASQVLTGFANGKKAESAGVFSSSNYFQLPIGKTSHYDAIAGGPVMITMVLFNNDQSTLQTMLSHGSQSNHQGFQTETIGGGDEQLLATQAGNMFGIPSNIGGMATGRYDVLTWGYDGAKFFFHANGLTNTPSVQSGYTFSLSSSSYPVRIGLPAGPSSPTRNPWNGTFVELRVTTTVPTDAVINALHTSITG